MNLKPLPAGLSMRDPAVLIATGFGSGRLYPAPGTWGSLAAWVIGLGLMLTQGKPALILALFIACIAGWWATEKFEEKSGSHDNGMIVIDEWAGLWLAMIFCGPHPLQIFLCLVFFRLFDIWKPFPINWIDKNVAGAGGVMLDDLVAGVFAAICVYGAGLWMN